MKRVVLAAQFLDAGITTTLRQTTNGVEIPLYRRSQLNNLKTQRRERFDCVLFLDESSQAHANSPAEIDVDLFSALLAVSRPHLEILGGLIFLVVSEACLSQNNVAAKNS